MKEHDSFLENYKRLEVNIRNLKNMQIKEYEDYLNEQGRVDDADKLRFCRTVRNYMSHHSEAIFFVGITKEMVLFVSGLNEEINEYDSPVKKKMIPLSKALYEGNSLAEAATFLIKRKLQSAPVFSKSNECIGVVDPDIILSIISDGKSPKTTRLSVIKECKKRQKLCVEISGSDPYSKILSSPTDTVFLVKEDKNNAVCGFISGRREG